MNKAGVIFVSSCIGVALFFGIMALGFPGKDSFNTPGSGYFPLVICSIIVVLCLILLAGYLRRREQCFQKDETERKNLPVTFLFALVTLCYVVALVFIPFIPVTIAFIIFLNRLFKRSWKFNIPFSIILTAVIYVVFAKFLHVML
jgi:hypothetical protein